MRVFNNCDLSRNFNNICDINIICGFYKFTTNSNVNYLQKRKKKLFENMFAGFA